MLRGQDEMKDTRYKSGMDGRMDGYAVFSFGMDMACTCTCIKKSLTGIYPLSQNQGT